MKKKNYVTAVLAVALIISVAVNITLWICWPSSPVPPEQSTVISNAPEPEKTVGIDTPYGTLLYPEQYIASLKHEGVQEAEVYSHTFSIQRPENTIELFSIHFGDEKHGTVIGYLQVEDSPVAVTVTSTEFIPDENWSAEETEQFNAMLMAVNDVIASVKAWDNYIR